MNINPFSSLLLAWLLLASNLTLADHIYPNSTLTECFQKSLDAYTDSITHNRN